MQIRNYEEAMEYVEKISSYGSVLGLESMKKLLEYLGNPEKKLTFVHVAGTNGKGSVCTMLEYALREAGYKTGRYVSPTLFAYEERIQIGGDWIDRERLVSYLSKAATAASCMVEEGFSHPTIFEIETAVAFLAFVEAKCDIVILEVGMGGRLDATNVIENCLCAVITPVSKDHTAFLGNTLKEIAGEKAGIIKEGCLVVSSVQDKEVREVLLSESVKKNAMLYFAANKIEEINLTLERTEFLTEVFGENAMVSLKLPGRHQIENALTAIKVLEVLKDRGIFVSREQLLIGFEKAEWKGRFSVVKKDPLIIADGAHNIAGARALKQATKLYLENRPIIRIIGVFRDKEYDEILRTTINPDDCVIAVQAPGPRGLEKETLAKTALKYAKNIYTADSMKKAFEIAKAEAAKTENSAILVYGTLSIMNEVYKEASRLARESCARDSGQL